MKTVTFSVPDPASIRNGLLKFACAVLLLYLCFLVREIWVPLGLAFILAMVLDPVVDRMELKGWSRAAASGVIFGGFISTIAGVLIALYPFAVTQADSLQRAFVKYFPDPSHKGLVHSFVHMGLQPMLANSIVFAVENLREGLQRSSAWFEGYGMMVVSNAIWIVIIPIVAFYALRDFHVLLAKGLLLVPTTHRDIVQTAVAEITAVFGKYLRGMMIVSSLNGIATAILLQILHVPSALILGGIAALLYSVPYIGALLTLIVTGMFAFLGGGLHLALFAVGLSFLLHQLVFDQIISPRVLGGQVGLHPILSIIALLVGNLLLGIVGMILAVPVAACIQIAVLAIQPKLSRQIDITAPETNSHDTVSSLIQETKEQEQKIDASQEIHASVLSAVESIEHEIADSLAKGDLH